MARPYSLFDLSFIFLVLLVTSQIMILANRNGEAKGTSKNSTNPTISTPSTKLPSTDTVKNKITDNPATATPKKSCPSTCDCPSDSTIDCSGRGLTVIPSIDPNIIANVRSINLANNNLTRFEYNITQKSALPKLEKLDLSHNSIQIVTISKKMTIGELDLSYNKIANIANLTLPAVERLKLGNNLIKTLTENFFDDEVFSNLTSLDISGNPIRSIPDRSFKSLKKTEVLVISSLGLLELKNELMHGMDQLKTLDLSGNQLSRVPNIALRYVNTLQKLLFNSNPIKALTSDDFSLITGLRHLEIKNCQNLETIQAEAFTSLINIVTIIISNNPNLSKVDPLAFKNNTNPQSLKTLDFSNNKLSTLDRMSLSWDFAEIDLSQNPWHCDCEISWMKSYPSLGNMHCASPENYKDMDVAVSQLPDCNSKQSHQSISVEMKITLILTVLLIASLVIGSVMAIKHNSFCRRLVGREQYSSVYYTKAEFGPMDAL